jgi:hypothetical protein
MPSALEKDFDYYLKHQDELVRKYAGRYLVIRDEEVVGAFDHQLEAVQAGAERFPLGSFLVQKCEPGEESYTQTFHSRVFGSSD